MIATLCLNPAIDVAYDVTQVAPIHKLRSTGERYDPGGGGNNVARVITLLGGSATAYYLAGGATGAALDGLLDEHGLTRCRISILGTTRISTTVHERETSNEYRFVPAGPKVSEAEWRSCLEVIETLDCQLLVASGSLPRGVPEDFYGQVQKIAERRGFRLVLDTSGTALDATLDHGGLYLVKPSLSELQEHVGHSLDDLTSIANAAGSMVAKGAAAIIAVTMGSEGALLASKEGVWHAPAIPVDAKSAVGAGDSFLGAMVLSLSQGQSAVEAFRHGMAAGAAAVLTPGTELCHPDDVARLYARCALPARVDLTGV